MIAKENTRSSLCLVHRKIGVILLLALLHFCTATACKSKPKFESKGAEKITVGNVVAPKFETMLSATSTENYKILDKFPPFQVIFLDSNSVPRCAGTILNAHFILSAAHCFSSNTNHARTWSVVADVNSKGNEQVRMIKRIYTHHGYTIQNGIGMNDIALVELGTPIKFNAHALPVHLPKEHDVARGSAVATATATSTATSRGRGMESFLIQKLTLSIMSNTKCAEMCAEDEIALSPSILCAGNAEGLSSWPVPDIGSPLTVLRNGHSVLVGVLSSSNRVNCKGLGGYLGMYTKVSKYLQWIDVTIAEATPSQAVVEKQAQDGCSAHEQMAGLGEALDIVTVDCGGLVTLPGFGKGVHSPFHGHTVRSTFLLNYEATNAPLTKPGQQCLWTFNEVHNGFRYTMKANVTLMCGGGASVLNWNSKENGVALANQLLSARRRSYRTISNSEDWKLFLSHTQDASSKSKTGLVVLVDIVLSEIHRNTGSNFAVISNPEPGTATYGPYDFGHFFSIVVNLPNPKQRSAVTFSVNHIDSFVWTTSCLARDSLDVYEIRQNGSPHHLARLCGSSTLPAAFTSEFPLVALFWTEHSTFGNGLQLSWS